MEGKIQPSTHTSQENNEAAGVNEVMDPGTELVPFFDDRYISADGVAGTEASYMHSAEVKEARERAKAAATVYKQLVEARLKEKNIRQEINVKRIISSV